MTNRSEIQIRARSVVKHRFRIFGCFKLLVAMVFGGQLFCEKGQPLDPYPAGLSGNRIVALANGLNLAESISKNGGTRERRSDFRHGYLNILNACETHMFARKSHHVLKSAETIWLSI